MTTKIDDAIDKLVEAIGEYAHLKSNQYAQQKDLFAARDELKSSLRNFAKEAGESAIFEKENA